jgi:hypothetical protein
MEIQVEVRYFSAFFTEGYVEKRKQQQMSKNQ